MLPREEVIGAVVVLAQLLYILVYPFAEQSVRSLPHSAVQAESWLHEFLLSRGLRQPQTGSNADDVRIPAVARHKRKPHEGQFFIDASEDEENSTEEEVEWAVTERMIPHMSSVTEALKKNVRVNASSRMGLDISWESHRIVDARAPWLQVPWAYLQRVKIRNVSPHPCLLQGVARFYVLRSADGLVFPIYRTTEGPSGFMINSGQEYRYGWIWFSRYQTTELSGGLLLENRTLAGEELEERFFNTTLATLEPAKAKVINSEEALALLRGYQYMGVFDMRNASYL
mmetsp:Transcript_40350/g.75415  ORF Transcript_40350/g.75415 Transcript_40350/m.75415 type:complete len:285 (-) Transcript_40350:197-1051(-)